VLLRGVEFLHVELKYSLQQDDGRHIADSETVRGGQVSSLAFSLFLQYSEVRGYHFLVSLSYPYPLPTIRIRIRVIERFLGMWRIPNLHPNPAECGTFLSPKSDGYLKSDNSGFTDLETVVSVQFINYLYIAIIFVNTK